MIAKENIVRSAASIIVAAGAVSHTQAQIESSIQDSARPLNMNVVNPVMMGGSDDSSHDFQINVLPLLQEAVNLNLNEKQAIGGSNLIGLNSDQLTLTHDSDIRAYFVGEGAGYHNTLGFSVISEGSGVSPVDSVYDNGQIVFPDASAPNDYLNPNAEAVRTSSAPLLSGDFVEMGDFESGETINFFLIPNGGYGRTSPIWMAGPENNPDGIEHVVSFAMAVEDSPYLMIGFEDLYGGGDEDYNDLLFAVDIGQENVQALVIAATPLPPAIWIGIVLVGFIYCRQRKNSYITLASN